MTNETQSFRKTYLSLYSKGLRKGYCVRGELETEQNCNVLTPSSSGYNSTSFSFSWAAQPGAPRAQLSAGPGSHCFELQPLIPNSDLQLTRTSCSTGLYNCFTSTCFSERCICTQFNPSTVKVILWYVRPDTSVIYTGAFLIWQLGRVGGQYVTTVCKLFVFDRSTLYHITVCKVFAFDRSTLYRITVCKLFVFDRSTLYHITVCELFVFDRSTLYHIMVCKLFVFDSRADCIRLPYYLARAGGRIIGFILLSRVFVLWEI